MKSNLLEISIIRKWNLGTIQSEPQGYTLIYPTDLYKDEKGRNRMTGSALK